MRRILGRVNRELARTFGYEVTSSRYLAHQRMMLNHYRAVSEASKTPPHPDMEARLLLLGRMLKPHRVTSHRKIRVGGPFDGGYVMLDDFTRLRTAFSLGVGPNVDWDHAMAERGIDLHQFDHTVPGPPRQHARFHFHPRKIDNELSAETENLESLMHRYGSATDFSNLLKIDIEGSEWALFAHADPNLLAKFPQILCEFHSLGHVHDDAHYAQMMEALRRLRQNFEIVHIHGNNVGGRTFIGDQTFPYVAEVTFANKALYAVADEPEIFPTPLDTPNHSGEPDYYLGHFRLGQSIGDDSTVLESRAARTQDASFFDKDAYLRANPDVAASGMDAWTHWRLFGRSENRCLSLDEKNFDAAAYLNANPDVADAGFDGLTHWRHFGRREGRPLSPMPLSPSGRDMP